MVLAAQFAITLRGGAGVRVVCEFLELSGLSAFVGASYGSQYAVNVEVQEAVVRSIPGLERAVLLRHGYAVEYDSVPSWQVDPTLAVKNVPGLYLAGGGVHPGAGVPMVSLSGRLAAERLLQDQASTQRWWPAATSSTTSSWAAC